MKCFYHSADLDGHCSGAIVKQKYPECEMIGVNHGQDFPFGSLAQDGQEIVFLVDFCLQPFGNMEALNAQCNLVWIDHHATGSIDEAQARGFIAGGGQLIEVGRAGCELTWEYIYGANVPPPHAVWLLGRYDVWEHGSDEDILPFQYGMRQFTNTLPDNTGFWAGVFSHDYLWEKIADTGRTLLSYETSQNEKFCKAYAFETYIKHDGYDVFAICANRGFTNSKLFDSVYDPDRHHIMMTFIRLKPPARKWTVSLYSTREDVDCGAIAKAYGGGGHKGAAGFQCIELPFSI